MEERRRRGKEREGRRKRQEKQMTVTFCPTTCSDDCADLPQSDNPLLRPHDTTLQHNKVVPHDTVVMESTL